MTLVEPRIRGRVHDAVVIVTGGANGLGRAYAEALSGEGARVVVADLDAAGAGELARELGPEALGVAADVASPESAVAMVDAAVERWGRVDVLVNNAGTYPHVAFDDISYEAWRRVLRVNLDSAFLCSRAVLDPMRAAGAGKIINVATNLVWTGLAGMTHYIAAKSGVVGFTRALARELGVFGITVNALAPGALIPVGRSSEESQARAEQIVAHQCVHRPQTAADLVGPLVFLASPDADFVTGQVLTVDGGLTTH